MLFLPLAMIPALHGGDSEGLCTFWDLWVKWCGSWFGGVLLPSRAQVLPGLLKGPLSEIPPPLLAAGLLVTPSLPQVSLAAFLRTTL